MRKGILWGSAVLASCLLVSALISQKNNPGKKYYQPRIDQGQYDGIRGAAEWLHKRRANQVTGEISPADVLQAEAQLKSMKFKKSSLGLQWTSMGPDNIGGRTRCFLIDKDNSNLMFAGAVSGGLFRSTTGGSSWTPVNDFQDNLAVSSLAQGPDGTIYFGTGEDLYYSASGTRSMGILGGGIFKSTDGGQTFTRISSTEPTGNTSSANWAAVGKIEVDPSDGDRIYAATNKGLKISSDGGDSWGDAISFPAACRDMTITTSGRVWAHMGGYVYTSASGDPGTYTQVSSPSPGANELPVNSSRTRIAVSPQDENYVYVVTTTSSGGFNKAYRSTDGGTTWTVIGQSSVLLNPHQTQGGYNNALAVDSKNKDRILVGGVTLWEWSLGGGWQQIASLSSGSLIGPNPYYVHADNHDIKFSKYNKNHIYVTNDGGIFRSTDNGFTWNWIVKDYVTLQIYGMGVGGNGIVIGGTQDNGTVAINPHKFLSKQGVRTNSINYGNVGLIDGDGGFADISKLVPSVAFKSMQYGRLGRTTDSGSTFNSFYDFDRMDPSDISGGGSSQFAPFVMPFALWEKLNDPASRDSILFKADSVVLSLGFGGGASQFSGTFNRPQASTQYIAEGFVIRGGGQVVTSDASGTLSGDGSGTFNVSTGTFSVTFNDPVSQSIIAKVAVRYDAGANLVLESAINEIPINYTLANALEPGNSVYVQDPVQAAFFVGLTTRILSNNDQGGIWMTRGVLSNLTGTPEWYHIGSLAANEQPSEMIVTEDGNTLYVGTEQGRVYRFTNLINARDSASTDIDDYISTDSIRPSTSVVQKTLLTIPGLSVGRTITSIAVHPDNPDKLVVTAGNYGNTQYVFYSGNATAPVPTFKAAQGDLPEFPVYASTFNFTGSENQVVIGTDYGIFTTDDITATSVAWSKENTGLANVPVFDLVQQRHIRFDKALFNYKEGAIYAGTHGRGFFKTASTEVVGIDEKEVTESASVSKYLGIYPNPATENINIELELTDNSDVEVAVRDIKGTLVKTVKFNKLSKNTESVKLDISTLSSGSYIVTLTNGNAVKSGKFIKK